MRIPQTYTIDIEDVQKFIAITNRRKLNRSRLINEFIRDWLEEISVKIVDRHLTASESCKRLQQKNDELTKVFLDSFCD